MKFVGGLFKSENCWLLLFSFNSSKFWTISPLTFTILLNASLSPELFVVVISFFIPEAIWNKKIYILLPPKTVPEPLKGVETGAWGLFGIWLFVLGEAATALALVPEPEKNKFPPFVDIDLEREIKLSNLLSLFNIGQFSALLINSSENWILILRK